MASGRFPPLPPRPADLEANRGPTIVRAIMAFAVLATVTMGLRLYARAMRKIYWAMDDSLLLVGLIFSWGCCVQTVFSEYQSPGRPIAVIACRHQAWCGAVGTDMTEIGCSGALRPGQAYSRRAARERVVDAEGTESIPIPWHGFPSRVHRSHGRQVLFAHVPTFGTALLTIKLSILLLYRRLFIGRRTVIILYLLGAVVTAWWLSTILVWVFQCNPVRGQWDWTVPATCISQRTIFIATALPTPLTDIAMLLVPVVHVWRLQMTRSRQLVVSGMFLLGAL